MFATALLIYLIATTSINTSMTFVIATVIVDVVAWSVLRDAAEAWATGTTSDQEFWNRDN